MAQPYTVYLNGGGSITVNANSPEAAIQNANQQTGGQAGTGVIAGGHQTRQSSSGQTEYNPDAHVGAGEAGRAPNAGGGAAAFSGFTDLSQVARNAISKAAQNPVAQQTISTIRSTPRPTAGSPTVIPWSQIMGGGGTQSQGWGGGGGGWDGLAGGDPLMSLILPLLFGSMGGGFGGGMQQQQQQSAPSPYADLTPQNAEQSLSSKYGAQNVDTQWLRTALAGGMTPQEAAPRALRTSTPLSAQPQAYQPMTSQQPRQIPSSVMPIPSSQLMSAYSPSERTGLFTLGQGLGLNNDDLISNILGLAPPGGGSVRSHLGQPVY